MPLPEESFWFQAMFGLAGQLLQNDAETPAGRRRSIAIDPTAAYGLFRICAAFGDGSG
jgi:hypothetical protein